MTRQEVHQRYRERHRAEIAARRKAHYLRRKETELAQMRAYREKHRERLRAARKKHYEENKTAYSASAKAWYQRNRGETISRCTAYQKANPAKKRQWSQTWRRRNPEAQHAHRHNRRARMKNAEGRLTKRVVQQVYEDNIKKFGGLTCYLCFQPVEFQKASLDHRVPIARGGSNLYENLQVAHLTCNLRKNKLTEAEYHLRFTEVFCD